MVHTEIGQICLANAENGKFYRRAKIMHIDGTTVNIFLVDYGVDEWSVPAADLIEIPEKFVKSLPFQVLSNFLPYSMHKITFESCEY